MKQPTQDHNRSYDWLEQQELLVEVYRQMLIVAYARMKNKMDALDVVQDAWLKILQKQDTLKDPDKLIQWAKAIVANTAKNVIKRKVAYDELLREQAVLIQYHMLRESNVEKQYADIELLRTMKRLDEDTRKMLIYKYYYEWKDKEIAEAFGYPLGTVKARIHRGKLKFRQMIEPAFTQERS